jgi:hypothetical protein
MATWIFVPVGLRLVASLRWDVDNTVNREVLFSAMEQEGTEPLLIGRLDWAGHYEVSNEPAARCLRVKPERLARMAATVPVFERLAADLAEMAAIAYAQAGKVRPALEARWDIMTLDHPKRADQLAWSELSLADAEPGQRVYLRHLDGATLFNPPYMRLKGIPAGAHGRPAYLRVGRFEASGEPWASLRQALPKEFGPRENALLPAGVETRKS